jgi:hypothetical protein
MCLFRPPSVSVPATPPPAQLQTMQQPKDMTQTRDQSRTRLRRRGMWASIMTSPMGISGRPSVTGGGGGAAVTGG